MGICPLKFNSKTINVIGRTGVDHDMCKCEGDECEWWVEETNSCTVYTIAIQLGIMNSGKTGGVKDESV